MPKLEVLKELYKFIAPHIIGAEYKLIKQFLCLQMFTNPLYDDEKFHILIVGETGSAKTAIALDICKILPRSGYAEKNSTEKGITEAIINADGGIFFADEIDKMGINIRRRFLEPMQTGFVTEHKHRSHYRYNARINVTALANPSSERLMKGVPVIQQISFGKDLPFLARFHLILPCYQVSEVHYPDIAIMMANRRDDSKRIERLREIIITLKENIPEVKIDEKLAYEIGSYAKRLKAFAPSSVKSIITPRLIEGLISVTKARARMLNKSKADKEDFEYVRKLYDSSFLI